MSVLQQLDSIHEMLQKDLQYIDTEAKSAEKHFRTNKGSLSGWENKPADASTGWSIVK